MTNYQFIMSNFKKILLLIFIFNFSVGKAQFFDNDRSFDIFHSYTKWGVQVDGLAYLPATISGKKGDLSFQTQIGLSYKAGLVYNFNIVHHFGIRIGALLGQAPAINTFFLLKKQYINSDKDYANKKGARYSPLNFSFPILFEYRNFSIYRYIINVSAGIQIQRTSPATIIENYDNYYTTTVNNPGTWSFDPVFKVGWYYQFPRVMMQTNVVYKYRLVNQYEGFYNFRNLNNDPPNYSGTYVLKGNYIGLSLDFFFHKQTREVEAGCRTNQQSKQVHKRQKAQERAKRRQEKKIKKALKKKAKRMKKMRRHRG